MSLQTVNCVKAPLLGQAAETVCNDGKFTGLRLKRSSTDSGDLFLAKTRRKRHKNMRKKEARHPDARRLLQGRLRRLHSKPEAPFNSTQFLMQEHDELSDTDLSVPPKNHRGSTSSVDLEDHPGATEEEKFLAKEFWNEFGNMHAERLHTMSKFELIQEFFALEDKVLVLQRQLDAAERPARYEQIGDPTDKMQVLINEMKKLENENEILRSQNIAMKQEGKCRKCCTGSENFTTGSSSDEVSYSTSSDSETDSVDSDCKNFVVTPKDFVEDLSVDSGVGGGSANSREDLRQIPSPPHH